MASALPIAVLLLLCLLPTASGLLGSLLAWPPALTVSDAWPQQLSLSLLQSLWVALASTTVALLLALLLARSGFIQRQGFLRHRWVAPLLSLPHVAFAIGLLMLVGDAGWLWRILPDSVSTWAMPNKSLTALITVLSIKEMPFLLLMLVSQRNLFAAEQWLAVATRLGYSTNQSYWLCVVPELLRRVRLPIAAVLIYGLAVVDVALLVGPNTPSTLAVRVYQWSLQQGELALAQTQLGSVLLIAVALILLAVLYAAVEGYQFFASRRLRRGPPPSVPRFKGFSEILISRLWFLLTLAVVLLLILQSVAFAWFYPQWWPQQFSWQAWQSIPKPWLLLGRTAILALLTATLAVVAVGVISAWRQQLSARQRVLVDVLLLLPLLLPQISLVLGWRLWLPSGLLSVVWAHCVFAVPYAFLVLIGPYQQLTPRWRWMLNSLGYGRWRTEWLLLRGKLLPALGFAWVIAFSVSVAQYLPTQLLGAGRLPTVTTEAVATASGGAASQTATMALLQALLPLLAFMGYRLYDANAAKSGKGVDADV